MNAINEINETKLLLNYEVLKLYLDISLSYLAAVVLTKRGVSQRDTPLFVTGLACPTIAGHRLLANQYLKALSDNHHNPRRGRLLYLPSSHGP